MSTTLNDSLSQILDSNTQARIVLHWNEGELYLEGVDISTIQSNNTSGVSTASSSQTMTKLPSWDKNTNYQINDLVAWEGIIYKGNQANNKNNAPDPSASFWWEFAINLASIDSISVQGKTLEELADFILKGKDIVNMYSKDEVNAMLIQSFNTVNARQLGGKSLEEIQQWVVDKVTTSANTIDKTITDFLAGKRSDLEDPLLTIFRDYSTYNGY